MGVNVAKYSRLLHADLKLLDDVEFFDIVEPPRIIPQKDDIRHILISGERLTHLATRYYRDPTLWWIIATVNEIDCPPIGLTAGNEILIPSPRYILETYFNDRLRPRRGGT